MVSSCPKVQCVKILVASASNTNIRPERRTNAKRPSALSRTAFAIVSERARGGGARREWNIFQIPLRDFRFSMCHARTRSHRNIADDRRCGSTPLRSYATRALNKRPARCLDFYRLCVRLSYPVGSNEADGLSRTSERLRNARLDRSDGNAGVWLSSHYRRFPRYASTRARARFDGPSEAAHPRMNSREVELYRGNACSGNDRRLCDIYAYTSACLVALLRLQNECAPWLLYWYCHVVA